MANGQHHQNVGAALEDDSIRSDSQPQNALCANERSYVGGTPGRNAQQLRVDLGPNIQRQLAALSRRKGLKPDFHNGEYSISV